jgi:hypothetical protein
MRKTALKPVARRGKFGYQKRAKAHSHFGVQPQARIHQPLRLASPRSVALRRREFGCVGGLQLQRQNIPPLSDRESLDLGKFPQIETDVCERDACSGLAPGLGRL